MGNATDCQPSAEDENKALCHNDVACIEKASDQNDSETVQKVRLYPIQ